MSQIALTIGGSQITPPNYIPHGGINYLELLAKNFMMVFLFFGVCLMVIYITWGGVQWISSGGDKQKLTAARQKITIAIVGFIMLLISYGIVGAIGYLFKVNLLDI